jgi:hypothetical protein
MEMEGRVLLPAALQSFTEDAPSAVSGQMMGSKRKSGDGYWSIHGSRKVAAGLIAK